MKRSCSLLLAGVLVMVVSAGPVEISETAVAPGAVPLADETLDDLFTEVALRVPAFGGMFYRDREQVLRVVLTDTSPRTLAAARAAIVDVFDDIIPAGGVKTKLGRYGFLELREWYGRLAPAVWRLPGVTFTDIDEQANRLTIGVERRRDEEGVLPALASLGIPADAVGIQVTGRVLPLSHTVQSAVTPRQGGYVITRLINNQTGYGPTMATLGFNALRSGIAGFVTSSHATQVFWGLDSLNGFPPADFYQSYLYVPSQLVGTETVDPPGFSGGSCPVGFTCRYSDSAFVAYNANVTWAKGIIARTLGVTMWDGLTPPPPELFPEPPPPPGMILAVSHAVGNNVGPGRFGITAPASKPYLAGLQLHKVGRRTGWTSGVIEGTCADYPVAGGNVLRCQYQVGNQGDPTKSWWRIFAYGDNFGPGDSGAPVFRIRNAAWRHVELYGIVSFGHTFSSTFGAKKLVFSPIGGVKFQKGGIQADLGALDFIEPCLPPIPPC